MAADLENLARALLQNVPGGKGIENEDKFMGLLHSQEGRQLLSRMSDREKEEMARAGTAAAQGDSGALRKVMLKLMSSKEGSSLIKQAMDIYHGKG